MKISPYLITLCAAVMLLACREANSANIPVGITDLFASLKCAVGYRYFDKESNLLGYGWTGYDPTSGVYFLPEDNPERVSQVFMHCPWINGTGTAFADFAVKMPATSTIRLSFEIGIRQGAKGTDGVTFRVKAGGKVLFEQNCTWMGEFRQFSVALDEFAGKEITLRLEVDPGPARNSTCDWSLWRNAQIIAGTEKEVSAAKAKAEAENAVLRAADLGRGQKLAEASLAALDPAPNTSVCPSVLGAVKQEVKKEGNSYIFSCKGSGETIEYAFQPEKGLLSGILVRVNGKLIEPAPFIGNPIVHLDNRDFGLPGNELDIRLEDVQANGTEVVFKYKFVRQETGSTAELKARLWPEGKSLGIEVWGSGDQFSGFTARPIGQKVSTAFILGSSPAWQKECGVYLSASIDLMRSEASTMNGDMVSYSPLTNGRRNAMHDIFYLTVSSRYEEVIPNLTHKPSPFLEDLSKRVVLDAWGGSFAENNKWLEDMNGYGVNNFFIIKHVWQRDGYDHSYPNVMPANKLMGGDEGLNRLSLDAQKLGNRFCVHENFYDYYPNAESFKKEDRCLDPQGKPVPGWDNGSVRAVILKPSRLMDYAREFTPEIKKLYGCDADYHDIMPTWNVDYDANVKDAGKIRVTHEITGQLCDFDRSLFNGPVVFEAAEPLMAGAYDGGCNYGIDTYRIPTAVAYELLKVHPKMSNHGFGYYERWLPWGYTRPNWSNYVMTDRELDKYRAYEVAFGRTGFIGQQLMKNPHGVIREYYLMQAFARSYTGKPVTRIRYEADGKWIDAGTASRYGELSRLNVEYEGGQQVFANLSDSAWQVAGYELPSGGVLSLGPRAQAWTALRNGQICDYANYGNIVFADARSHQWLPSLPPSIEPSVKDFKYLGGKKFELTTNWKPYRSLDRNYTVFLHFVADGSIKFQADHLPSKSTTGWETGVIFADGPIRLTVKDDPNITSYDIITGLYDKEGRAILIAGFDSIRIGKLMVERDGSEIKSIRVEPAVDMPYGSSAGPYLEGANTGKKVIDFGSVATNGAVVVRTTKEGFEVIPVPIGEDMRVGLTGAIKKASAFDRDGKLLCVLSVQISDGKTWFDIPADKSVSRVVALK